MILFNQSCMAEELSKFQVWGFIFFLTFYLEIIRDSREFAKRVQRRFMEPLPPVSLTGYVLHNYSTISQLSI